MPPRSILRRQAKCARAPGEGCQRHGPGEPFGQRLRAQALIIHRERLWEGALERLPEALKIWEDAGIAPQVIPFYRHPVPWGQGGRRRAMTSPAPRQGGA